MKKIFYILILSALFSSCTGEGAASIEKSIVVEQVNLTKKRSDCSTCLQNSYSYRVKLKSHSGEIYYYTDFRHDVGDTLLSVFEFNDDRDFLEFNCKKTQDSIVNENVKLSKKLEEALKYNEILLNIIEKNK